jgi:hypothetical protein
VSTQAGANAFPSGVSALGESGFVSITGTSVTSISGVSATASVGIAEAYLNLNVFVSGVSASGFANAPSVIGTASVFPVGVQANTFVSRPLVWGLILTEQSPVWTYPVSGLASPPTQFVTIAPSAPSLYTYTVASQEPGWEVTVPNPP